MLNLAPRRSRESTPLVIVERRLSALVDALQVARRPAEALAAENILHDLRAVIGDINRQAVA